jgi:hypothetical protein
MSKIECDQKKCGYLQMGMGCRACETCNTEPYILDSNCDRCWNCCKDEGILRWDDNNTHIDEKQDEKKREEEKPMEIEAARPKD